MGIRPTVALWHTARTGAIGQKLTLDKVNVKQTFRLSV